MNKKKSYKELPFNSTNIPEIDESGNLWFKREIKELIIIFVLVSIVLSILTFIGIKYNEPIYPWEVVGYPAIGSWLFLSFLFLLSRYSGYIDTDKQLLVKYFLKITKPKVYNIQDLVMHIDFWVINLSTSDQSEQDKNAGYHISAKEPGKKKPIQLLSRIDFESLLKAVDFWKSICDWKGVEISEQIIYESKIAGFPEPEKLKEINKKFQ